MPYIEEKLINCFVKLSSENYRKKSCVKFNDSFIYLLKKGHRNKVIRRLIGQLAIINKNVNNLGLIVI